MIEPVVVMPPVYWLPSLNRWYWCKLVDVRNIVPQVARLAGNDYQPTLEELVRHFVALSRYNKFPEPAKGIPRKKMFRYSFGDNLCAVDVPYGNNNVKKDPPWVFSFGEPLKRPLGEMYVPAGWTKDTLRAIHAGAVSAAQWSKDELIGYRPDDKPRPHIFHIGLMQTTSDPE